ncbi:MAG: TatD family hydrolase [Methanobrevibacter sp.]|uniref:TatD family hydrolase n=1 Tax=Methanobrevibacter sp. TaxID=66852 RepID=UPI00257FE25A|nr:TatD family hydrolase [Methanobrevibacter sp.]MBR2665253.1 TatD family hydrolase [Methanobrevibacter sp.]MBR7050813.1 TatD family hydrolase [Methanobrevibacter sp.]
MIDTHCHIDFEEFDDDREDVIKRAKDKLDHVIVSGYSNESNMKVLQLSKDYEGFIYPTFGFHPVSSQNASEEDLKIAHENIRNNLDSILAVGEVGMDYYYVTDKALRERQQEIFKSFLELANEYRVPIVMHVRDCEKKAVNIIEDYDDIPYFVFHCYGGSLKTAKRIMNRDDSYMSFSTMLCYSKHHQDLIEKIDLDYVLTETDSPFLAMTKEERNEPANVVKAVHKIAEIKNMDVSTVDEITTNNARKIFKI